MESSNLPLWALILLLAGVLAALAVGVRRTGPRPQVDPDRHPTQAQRPKAAPLIIGPSEVIVVGPAKTPPLIIGPAEPVLVGPSRQTVFVVGPSAEPTLVISPAKPLTIAPPPRGAWDERGWILHSEEGRKVYEGYYRVTERRTGLPRRFRGRVVMNHREAIPYIADPPPEIRRHPKGPCFTYYNGSWFRVEWSRPARNVDDAILYVEKVLDEALNG